MKILVSEAVEVVFHCHNQMQEGWTEGKFGNSLAYDERCRKVVLHYYAEESYKVYKITPDHYIVFAGVGVCGYEGKTIKEAVEKSFEKIGGTPSFEFDIKTAWVK